jgi:hypothetical protein
MKPAYQKLVVVLLTVIVTGMAIYMKFTTPSPQAQCREICAKSHRSGSLNYKGPFTSRESKPYVMDRDCECS